MKSALLFCALLLIAAVCAVYNFAGYILSVHTQDRHILGPAVKGGVSSWKRSSVRPADVMHLNIVLNNRNVAQLEVPLYYFPGFLLTPGNLP